MTTLVLQAAGSAIGSYFGPIGEIVGRAAGALAGSVVDRNLLGADGGRPVEGPRLSEMRGLSAAEGEPVPRLYGRARLGGQLIWATRFEEQVVTTVRRSGGGKGGGGRTRERSYAYYANIAVALCEGPISFVRRVWADGREIDLTPLAMRVHRGGQEQEPDPLIVAKEGAADAPAYRGVAYVVFERLPLEAFGDRIPQFAFEVVRALPGLPDMVRSVNLIPGSTEFGYDPVRIDRTGEFGGSEPENRAQLQAETDVLASLDQLQALCPNLTGVNLVVSWFGDDLRAGECTIAPRVDQPFKETDGGVWRVAGLARAQTRLVTWIEGRPAYGGTPSDASVLALIAELKRRGLKVTLYPFIMMDVPPGNVLPNPYGGEGQAVFPWRGRISCHPAPGVEGSVDASSEAAAQVADFVGAASPGDFSTGQDGIICAKPEEWSFRRHILHHAALAQAAGGVDAFVIGTEMVGLTRVRSAPGVYPFAEALRAVAADCRAMLGPDVRIVYAADWTEYGAHVLDGGQEVRFPLDGLWASEAVDAVGIDYYAPIGDWRDGPGHLDAAEARSPHDTAYLSARQRAGEAFDWYYADRSGREAQARLPIADGAYGKPWIFRQKDIAGWWLNEHRERVGGVELAAPTPWRPGMKPVWLTEIGCPAVDKGSNSPNIFPDARSSEGGFPAFSSGERDDLMQHRALVAQIGAFDPSSSRFRPDLNPLAPSGGFRMVSAEDASVWAWDARPYPAFPMQTDLWSDGANWASGHWITGRLENAPVDILIAAILADYGLPPAASLAIDHIVDGYVLDRPMSAREALEPLGRLFGLEATFGADGLRIAGLPPAAPLPLSPDAFVPDREGGAFVQTRAQETELPRELRLGFVDGDWDYARSTSRSRRLTGMARREVAIEAPVVMPRLTGDRLADARLREAWASRERIRFALSPRQLDLEPGDAVRIPVAGADRIFRIMSLTDGETRRVEAVRIEAPAGSRRAAAVPTPTIPPPAIAGRIHAQALELPFTRTGDGVLVHLAARVEPWPGPLVIERSVDGGPFAAWGAVERPALFARSLGPLPPGRLWRWDGAAFDVEVFGGALQSVTDQAALAGANGFAVIASDGTIELIAAARAELVGPGRYRLSRLLRGLGGSEAAAGRQAAAGTTLVALDEALVAAADGVGDVGRSLAWRIRAPGAVEGDRSTASPQSTPAGLALRPLAPVHLAAERRPDGVLFRWVRRTRLHGDNWDLAEVPLGEASERYTLALHGPEGIRRQVEISEPRHLYPNGEELADFGAPQSSFDIGLAQLSAAVGAGAVSRLSVRPRLAI